MRLDVVKFGHSQFSFINEKFYHISLPKAIELCTIFFNPAVMKLRVQVNDQFIFTEADILMFDMKITVCCKCNQNLCHFFLWLCRLLSNSLIIQTNNCRKRCGCQQKIIDAFSLSTEEIETNTFRDSRTSHIDKMKYLSLKNGVN